MTDSSLLAPATERRTVAISRFLWAVYAAIAAALASFTLVQWWSALSFEGPMVYGEGAVVNAGLLIARGLDPYGPPAAGVFVGANYPPLAYLVVAIGSAFGDFLPLRAVNVLEPQIRIGARGVLPMRLTLLLSAVHLAFS